MQLSLFDLTFGISGFLFNILISAIFIAQKKGNEKLVSLLGIIWLFLGIPLFVVFVKYFFEAKDSGLMVAFGLILIYMAVEFLLEYVFKYDFRAKNITHVPYIILEYLALFGIIVISFDINPILGWIVSISFWVLMGSLIYLYAGKGKSNNLGS